MMAAAERLPCMRLADLLAGVSPVLPERDLPIDGLALDSREVRPGFLFMAVSGHDHHGLKHLAEARARGAAAVAYDPEGAAEYLPVPASMPAFAVQHLDQQIGGVAARFYADPSTALWVLAVTGTNGKTSVSELTAQLLTELGRSCGLLGTLGYGVYGAELAPPPHTTPDAVHLQQWLADFRDRNVRQVSMEASSHALDQGRLNGVHLHSAAFTNLTRDHLDYHGSMAAYGAAKRRLFELSGLKHAVINLDDAFGRELGASLDVRIDLVGYSATGAHATRGRVLRAKHVDLHAAGLHFDVEGDFGSGHVETRLLGLFNVYNLLAVLGLLLSVEVPFADALAALGRARTVPGRMECFGGTERKPLVVVDYAHTPDALEQALAAARAHCRGQLWCVFGCGGDRDRGKRPQMGAVAERLADHLIVTDDNPRREDGDAIVDEILAGVQRRERVVVQRQRARAIAEALKAATAQDVVLVAGKGHEDYQVIGDRRIAYSDRETVQRLLNGVPA